MRRSFSFSLLYTPQNKIPSAPGLEFIVVSTISIFPFLCAGISSEVGGDWPE
jgi:hypothetical protein